MKSRWRAMVTKTLLDEWQNLVFRLPQKYRQQLRPPMIVLNPDLSAWGRWQGGQKRLLELKTQLVEKHPWYAVLEIFRHEIAHQIMEECFPGVSEAPHGLKFRSLCLRLGTNPAASGTYPTLDQRVFGKEEEGLSEESKLVLKVRKLLALAESANHNEAKTALLKAQELTEKYAISMDEHAGDEEFFSIAIGKAVSRRNLVHVKAANILQNFYNVMVIWDTFPDPETLQYRKVLVIHGTRSNIKIASYAFDCLFRQIDCAWKQVPIHLQARKSPGYAKRDFAVGLLNGFYEALDQQHQERPAEVQALVLQQNKRLEGFYRQMYPHIRTRLSRGGQQDPLLTNEGEKAGREFILHPGLSPDPNPKKRLSC